MKMRRSVARRAVLTDVISQSAKPLLALSGNGNAISNGDTSPRQADYTSYGAVPTASPLTRTFVISNAGKADLIITAVDVPSAFTVTTSLPLTVAKNGGVEDLEIRFDCPVSALIQRGDVTITSNADDNPSFVFRIEAALLYHERVLATSPLRYNKMDEGSGTTMTDSAPSNFSGTYTGIAWGSGNPPQGGDAPFFDGTNDIANLHSAAWATAFDFDEGSILIWCKVSAAWNEGLNRYIGRIRRDASNSIEWLKAAAVNRLSFNRIGGGAVKTINADDITDTGWFPVILEWSKAGDFFKAYKNGVQIGTTQTGLLAATGSGLTATTDLYGAFNTSLTQPWHGYLAHAAIWTNPASASILALSELPAA